MTLAGPRDRRDDGCVEPPIQHRDVTTIMRLLSDIQVDVREIRELLEEDEDGEEETLENDG
jgi:hypothetical protein